MQTRTWRSCTPRDVAADPGQPAQTSAGPARPACAAADPQPAHAPQPTAAADEPFFFFLLKSPPAYARLSIVRAATIAKAGLAA